MTRVLANGTAFTVGIQGNDFTDGQHGYARSRRGAKHAMHCAERRAAKEFISREESIIRG
jgi:hypothetical protein